MLPLLPTAAILAAHGLWNPPALGVLCKNGSLPGKQLAKFSRNDRANNNPHCALFSALFGAIPSLVRIRTQLKKCWIFYGCELQTSHLTDRYHCPEGLGIMASAHFLLCCSESGLSSCSNAKELLAHARRVRSPTRRLTLHREV